MNTNEVLTLLNLKGIGRKTVQKLLDVNSDSASKSTPIIEVVKKARETRIIHRIPSEIDIEQAQTRANRILLNAQNKGIKVIGFNSVDYPSRLRDIPDPPVILYCSGNVDCLNNPFSIAVIGTRAPNSIAISLASSYAGYMASKGIVIVSGLALGCDTAAHVGCLENNGRTIAVMAHGLDMVYPTSNETLAEKIITMHGCLISEYSPGVKPQKGSFVERDRLQSGLSDAVLVIQSGMSGGSMHTVRFAKKQNRIVSAVIPMDTALNKDFEGNYNIIETRSALSIGNIDELDRFLDLAFKTHAFDDDTHQKPNQSIDSPTQMNLFE